jgi:hypothetical protein
MDIERVIGIGRRRFRISLKDKAVSIEKDVGLPHKPCWTCRATAEWGGEKLLNINGYLLDVPDEVIDLAEAWLAREAK